MNTSFIADGKMSLKNKTYLLGLYSRAYFILLVLDVDKKQVTGIKMSSSTGEVQLDILGSDHFKPN